MAISPNELNFPIKTSLLIRSVFVARGSAYCHCWGKWWTQDTTKWFFSQNPLDTALHIPTKNQPAHLSCNVPRHFPSLLDVISIDCCHVFLLLPKPKKCKQNESIELVTWNHLSDWCYTRTKFVSPNPFLYYSLSCIKWFSSSSSSSSSHK